MSKTAKKQYKNYLDKLLTIAEGKVEWKTLGEVCIVSSGGTPSKAKPEFWEKGNIPWLKSESCNNESVYFASDFISELGLKNSSARLLEKETTLMALVGATIFKTAFLEFEASTNQNIASIKSNEPNGLIDKFVYYYLTNLYNDLKFKMKDYGMLNLSTLRQFAIPVPPLPIQQEIVRILDTFTELTAELTAELTDRKKQYEYYREYLFNLGNEKHIPMGDESIGHFIRGSGLQKKDFTETGVGCIHYGQIYTHYGVYTNKTKTFVSKEFAKKARKARYGNLVIATTSENDEDVCKAVAWLGDEEIAVSSDACFFVHNLNPKYVAYFFQTEQFQKQKRVYITGTKVRRVNVDNLAKIAIPIPSLAEQERIVAILDKFDALTNSISEGLPREIEIRQQQYEYYRNMLLNFPKQED